MWSHVAYPNDLFVIYIGLVVNPFLQSTVIRLITYDYQMAAVTHAELRLESSPILEFYWGRTPGYRKRTRNRRMQRTSKCAYRHKNNACRYDGPYHRQSNEPSAQLPTHKMSHSLK